MVDIALNRCRRVWIVPDFETYEDLGRMGIIWNFFLLWRSLSWFSWWGSKQVADISWRWPHPSPSSPLMTISLHGENICPGHIQGIELVHFFFEKTPKKKYWPQLWYVNYGGEQDIMGVGWKEVGGRQKVAIVRPWAKTGLGEHGLNKNLYM